jgi:hypothetical protein
MQKNVQWNIYAPVEQAVGIDRSQYAHAVEENNKRYQENPQLYRTRRNKQLVEFSSGNIGPSKRQWVTITSTTGRERVKREHSLIMLVLQHLTHEKYSEIVDLVPNSRTGRHYGPKSCFT